MGVSVKIVLHKNYKKKNGTYPIVLRVTKNRKSKYIFTGEYILEKDWDKKQGKAKKSHINSTRLNNLLLKKLSEAHDIALESQTNSESAGVTNIRKKIVGGDKMDFFAIGEVYLSRLKKRKKVGLYKTQFGRLQIFKRFLNSETLPINDLDVSLLNGFSEYLETRRGVSKRTVVNYLILIRTITNLGIKEYGVTLKNYPFGKDKVQIKLPESQKIGLSIVEVRKLENALDLIQPQQLAVHTWLLSFYFAGMRIADVLILKWSDFKDGRLFYRMGKNEKLVSLGVPDKALEILKIYKSDKEGKNELVLPYLAGINLADSELLARRKNTINRTINRSLKSVAKKLGINKNLSMHIARHSFGNISGDKIPIQMLQKLYRHSSITTTVNYQSNFMHKETDDALEKVINF